MPVRTRRIAPVPHALILQLKRLTVMMLTTTTRLQTITRGTPEIVEERAVLALTERTLLLSRARIRPLQRVRPYANARLTAVLVLDRAVVARSALQHRTLVDALRLGPWLARARVTAELICHRAVETRVTGERGAFVYYNHR
jgi:hypothetical protein